MADCLVECRVRASDGNGLISIVVASLLLMFDQLNVILCAV